MTLNLQSGDYARDENGEVYGPLEEWAGGRLYWGGNSWRKDGSPLVPPMGEAAPVLVAKVRRVETWEDVPPEPVRETRRVVVECEFRGDDGPEWVRTDGTLTFVNGTADWSTLRVLNVDAALTELARMEQEWDRDPVTRDDLLKMGEPCAVEPGGCVQIDGEKYRAWNFRDREPVRPEHVTEAMNRLGLGEQ